MGIRSINNPSASFRDRFVNTGKDAVNPKLYFVGEASGGNSTYTYSYGGIDYKIHKFTSNGTLEVSVLPMEMDILVLGGGGSGGGGNNSNYGSGGGAGGMLWRPAKELAIGTYNITIGQGGTWPSGQTTGNKGNDTVFTGNSYTLTGNAGGAGSGTANSTQPADCTGGCGAGAGRDAGNQAAGASNQNNSQDSAATAYGNAGGIATGTGCTSAGGGGGCGQTGHNGCYDCQSARAGTCSVGGHGVNILSTMDEAATKAFFWACRAGTDATGTTGGTPCTSLGSEPSAIYLGGGGGGAYEHSNVGQMADGGAGGGGRGGSRYGPIAGTHASANTGGGGGAGQKYASGGDGGNGASGLVLVRYTV